MKHLARATLESYAALLFTSGPGYGAAILAVTFMDPRLAMGGLIGALVGNAAARAFSFPKALIETGIYGVSPLLTGLSVAYVAWDAFTRNPEANERNPRAPHSSPIRRAGAYQRLLRL